MYGGENRMECSNICDAGKTKVPEWLDAMDDTERMLLLNKYSKQTENVYCTFSSKESIDFITKIHSLKFDKNALIESYENGDTVIDQPGCRLNEFLEIEMVKQKNQG
jgi:hypothetical protein